jgi:hypothetical protein
MRRVQHRQVQPCGTPAQQPGRAAEEILIGVNGFRGLQLGKNARVARDQGGGLDAFGIEGKRQRAGDVGQAAGFYQRENFGGDGEDADR